MKSVPTKNIIHRITENMEVAKRKTTDILALSSIFNGEFSIDWLQEMTHEKASVIISAMEKGVKNSWLQQTKPGFFQCIDVRQKNFLYEKISTDDKQYFHEQAVKILLREIPELSAADKLLGGHLLKINNNLEGCRQLVETGNRCRKQFQFNEAHNFYLKAIQDLVHLKGEDAELLFVETVIRYLKVSIPVDIGAVRWIITDAIKCAEKNGFVSRQVILRMSFANKEWLLANYSSALYQYNTARLLAKDIIDPEFKRETNVFHVFFQYWHGMLQDVVNDYDKNAPAIEEIPNSEVSFISHIIVAACLGHLGQVSQGIGMMDVVRKHCLKVGNINIACHAVSVMGLIMAEVGRFKESAAYFEEARAGSIKGHNRWVKAWAPLGLAYSYHKMGEVKKSISSFKEYHKLRYEMKYFFTPYPAMMSICWSMEQGLFPRMKETSLDQEITAALKSNNVFIKGVAYYYQALVKKAENIPLSEVQKSLKQSIKYLEKSGENIYLAKSRLEMARLLLKQGDENQAVELAMPELTYLSSINDDMVPDDFRFLLRDRNDERELLREILKLGQELVTFRDQRDLALHIISTVNRITGAERGAIFIMDPVTGKPVLKAAKNITSTKVKSPEFAGSMKFIEKIVLSGKGRIVSDKQKIDIHAFEGGEIRSLICVPMVLRDNIIGVLYHDNRIYHSTFQESDLEMLDFFAAQAAIALDNAQAYQSLQDQYQKEKEEKRYLEEQYLKDLNFKEIVGRSPAIKKVFSHIESVATTDTAVLILGETGAGKELVARAIHQKSARRDAPFIRVNCSALSETLIASELFGHEKGSFTGATELRLGRFELADGGTLFLDEIGDIPPGIQVKLLRVLQNNKFERVGGQKTIHSDFRLMAATNKDVEKEVQKGNFRMDLYYRLNVFPIHVPPLRDRKEDIGLLALHFLKIYAQKLNRKTHHIPAEELKKMEAYHWPGNVRELENFIERGVILNDQSGFLSPVIDQNSSTVLQKTATLSHEENERNHILNVLESTSWMVAGKKGAAALLEMHPNTLRYRMKKLGIRIRRKYDE